MRENPPASPDEPTAATLVAPARHDEAMADTQLAPPKGGVAIGRSPAPAVDRDAATLDAPITPSASSNQGLALGLADAERYEIAGEIARGGLGRILRATDKRLRRPVALKELLAPGRGSEARFLREAHITARLQHPSIIPLYDAGHGKSGDLFYSMKLVFGSSLEEAIDAKKTLADRLSLLPHVIDVAEAIAYAHSKRIIHRDLKPQNVLVGEFGETVVIDWGIAKDLAQSGADSGSTAEAASAWQAGAGADLTIDGAIMGTPAYMPPEQARGEPVDERADVYALGAILYHLLAGVPPYDDRELRDILRKLVSRPPVPPIPIEERLSGVPKDLCAIVDKAMASAPADRYPSAKELAADLQKFQTGQIVGAYRYTTTELAARWLRRNKLVALLLALIATGGAVSVASILDRSRAAEEGRQAALVAQRKAEAAEERERTRADEVTLEQARLSLEHDPQRALDFLAELSPSFPRMSAARMIAADALSRGLPVTLRGHEGGVFTVAYAPDGKLVASSSYDKTIRLWDVATGRSRVLAGHSAEVHRAVFSPDGKRLASVSYDKTVRLWDVDTGASHPLEGHTDWLSSVAFSGDGKVLASGSADTTIRLWDVAGASFTGRVLKGHGDRITSLEFSPDGRRLASQGADGTTRLWDTATGEAEVFEEDRDPHGGLVRFSPTGEILATTDVSPRIRLRTIASHQARWLAGHEGAVTDLAFSPDGARLASASADRTVRLWDVATGETLRVLRGHEAVVSTLAFSPDGRRLVTGADDQAVRLWDLETGNSEILRAHTSRVTRVAFSPDGRHIASSSSDGTVRLWTPAGERGVVDQVAATLQDIVPLGGSRVAVSTWGNEQRVCDVDTRQCEALSGHTDIAYHLALSRDKKLLATVSEDKTVRVWDVSSAPSRLVRVLTGHAGAVRDAAFFPDASRLATGGADHAVRIWDLATGESRVLTGHADSVSHVAVSPDGARVLSVSTDRTLRLWDVATGEPKVFSGHESWILDATFSPDGEQIASASLDRTVRVWSVETGQVRVFSANEGGIYNVVFSPDGRSLASGSDGGVVRVWEVATGASRAFPSDGSAVPWVAFSPDGLTLAAAVKDGAVRLWDVASGEGRALRGHHDGVRRVAFLPDGKRVCSTSEDGTLRVWLDDLPHDEAELRARIQALAARRAHAD